MMSLLLDPAEMQPSPSDNLFLCELKVRQVNCGVSDFRTMGLIEVCLQTGAARCIAALAPYTVEALERMLDSLSPGWKQPC